MFPFKFYGLFPNTPSFSFDVHRVEVVEFVLYSLEQEHIRQDNIAVLAPLGVGVFIPR